MLAPRDGTEITQKRPAIQAISDTGWFSIPPRTPLLKEGCSRTLADENARASDGSATSGRSWPTYRHSMIRFTFSEPAVRNISLGAPASRLCRSSSYIGSLKKRTAYEERRRKAESEAVETDEEAPRPDARRHWNGRWPEAHRIMLHAGTKQLISDMIDRIFTPSASGARHRDAA
jgi:hypothetical protein